MSHRPQPFLSKSTGVLLVVVFILMALGSFPQAIPSAIAQSDGEPTGVVLIGSLAEALGCGADDPVCASAALTFDDQDLVWQGTFDIPAGEYTYQAALNGSSDEIVPTEPITLTLGEDTSVKFFYDHRVGWLADNIGFLWANLPGTLQGALGCPGDWAPDCLRTLLTDVDGDGLYSFETTELPAGDYEVKVAYGETWDVNYGEAGESYGPNILFTVENDGTLTSFTYDPETFLLTIDFSEGSVAAPVVDTSAPATDEPTSVVLVGSVAEALGCDADDASCDAAALTYDEQDLVWQSEFDLPEGEYTYQVALNGSLDELVRAEPITLNLDANGTVKFIYDHRVGWLADNNGFILANLPGTLQSRLGCPGDWAPDCLRTLLTDVDGDGIYTFATAGLTAGDYEVKVAYDESWTENYGSDNAQDGPNIVFTVDSDGQLVNFSYDPTSHQLTIEMGAVAGSGGDEAPTMEPPGPTEDEPTSVVLLGGVAEALGCEADDVTCEAAALTFDEQDLVWQGVFDLTAGDYTYQAALNGSLDSVVREEPLTLTLAEDTSVKFVYDHRVGWLADNVNFILATLPGTLQSPLGCPPENGNEGSWQPDCLRSLLTDVDGDGTYSFFTNNLPEGNYEVKVAYDETWDVNYGADGAQDGGNLPFSVIRDGADVLFLYNPETHILSIQTEREAEGNLGQAQAHWVFEDTLVWGVQPQANVVYRLHWSPTGEIKLSGGEIVGGDSIELTYNGDSLNERYLELHPQLGNKSVFAISEADLPLVPEILKSQIAISMSDPTTGQVLNATSIQIPYVLDDLYYYEGDLGTIWEDGVPTVKVWAPTAQNVKFHLFADENPDTESTVMDMNYDVATGVWSITGEADWKYQYYLFEVDVWAPSTGAVEKNIVTDPYSFSLSLNSQRSQLVDLADPELMPEGWLDYTKPDLAAPEDIVLYELHVRDFSIYDESVPEEHRGKFLAFTDTESNGMQHLSDLAEAGLTHVHLLPLFDIATINEDASSYQDIPREELAQYGPADETQQELINESRDADAFNWGYDPFHYTVPEGSYSTDPNGATRIIEFRSAVMSLNETGLRVVMDVVYNHTNSAGQGDYSVLDKIVPGYYHRLSARGQVETSTCCSNTATEHLMMEKLMIDSVETWAIAYKVDGFRFDLMGHHMVQNMANLRAELDTLTLEEDGVDGTQIYVYGEGWNFGEVQDGAQGPNATQLNVGGLGIGTFNDRIRDAARGGNPFGDYQVQGFITGLYTNPNGITPGSEEEQLLRLYLFSDQIRIGLAGNLRDYTFINADGNEVTGADISYNGAPTGYTLDPQEHIVYVSAHDNETLWDAVQYKAPADADIATRVRMQNLGISLVTLSQGVPFLHAGVDMLRSKSFDKNSYNSGDWFNALDFTYNDNNWGHGLPLAGDNRQQWEIQEPLLSNPDLAVTQEDILFAAAHTQEMLRIRKSSGLFRLQTADDIQNSVRFLNTGPEQMPGVIVMEITNTVGLTDDYQRIVVVFNSQPDTIDFTAEDYVGLAMELHPIQQESVDPIVQTSTFADGTFSVPGYTTAVFVME